MNIGEEEGTNFDDDVEGGKLVDLMHEYSGVAIVGNPAQNEEMHGPHIYFYPRNLDQ